MIQLYTGNGKGKTTAALGTALRAAAKGMRVALVAFDKGGEGHYSERKIIRERIPEITIYVTGLDRIDPVTNKFRFGVTDEDRAEGKRGLEIVSKIFRDKSADLIIMDEINSSTSLGIVQEKNVLELLDEKPENVELILTGRDAPESFIRRADLVTDMQMVKHYYYQGEEAREGFDY
ncbi:MAG: cob(I)yrinic acid a,c-diamide adenosyltransferase, partial [Patescibacteria group bacterium]